MSGFGPRGGLRVTAGALQDAGAGRGAMGCKPSPGTAATRQQNHGLTAMPSSVVLPGAWLPSEVSATAAPRSGAGARGSSLLGLGSGGAPNTPNWGFLCTTAALHAAHAMLHGLSKSPLINDERGKETKDRTENPSVWIPAGQERCLQGSPLSFCLWGAGFGAQVSRWQQRGQRAERAAHQDRARSNLRTVPVPGATHKK